VTLGATGTILGGGDYRERTFSRDTSSETIDSYQEYDADISGLTGSFGVLVEMDRGVRFGATVLFPQDIDFDGVFYEEYDGYVDEFSFTDEITLPFRLGGGVALARRNLILGVDAIYTDWSQIDFAGPLRTADREFAYRETVDLHIGAEYLLSLPSALRIRAGYAYQPLAYRLLLTDVMAPRYEEARFDTNRHYLTFGLGMLLGETVTMDLAYIHGGYERSAVEASASRYVEEETDRRLLATLSVRVN
jgi:long-subunit fatty acid transport protein